MVAAVVVLAVLVAVLAVALVVQSRTHAGDLKHLDMQWRDERAELLNRIQRPEWIPSQKGSRPPPRPTDAKALAQIGSLTATDDDG